MAKPKTGGRQKGTPNKATADVKALYQKDAPEMQRELKRIALNSASDAARVSAIKEYNDRAYGRAPQAITGLDGDPIRAELIHRTMSAKEAAEAYARTINGD